MVAVRVPSPGDDRPGTGCGGGTSRLAGGVAPIASGDRADRGPEVIRAGLSGRQVDVTFSGYPYEGCRERPCVLLFQLNPGPGRPETFPFVKAQGEKTRFYGFDVGPDKVVLASPSTSRSSTSSCRPANGCCPSESYEAADRCSRTRRDARGIRSGSCGREPATASRARGRGGTGGASARRPHGPLGPAG